MSARRRGEDEVAVPTRASAPAPGRERPRQVPLVTGAAAVASLGRLAGNRAVSGLLAGTGPVVQRKLGFEFQSTRNTFVPGGGVPGVAEKERVYEGQEGLFRIEGDNATASQSDLEFVTTATDDIVDALAAVQGAANVATALGATGSTTVHKGAGPYAGRWLRDARIDAPDKTFAATPQATIGVPLAKVATLLANAMTVPVADREKDDPRTKVLREIRGERLDAVRTRTGAWTGNRPLSAAVSGLLSMIAYYLEVGSQPPATVSEPTSSSVRIDGVWWDLGTTDGPKASFGLMARTSFRAAFLSLSGEDQEVFRGLMQPSAARGAVGVESVIGDRLDMTSRFPVAPYLADPDVVAQDDALRDAFVVRRVKDRDGNNAYVVMQGPTVQQWLSSICADVPGHDRAGRDLMSPPIGWGKRDPAREQTDPFPGPQETRDRHLYGMGAYPMDTRTERGKAAENLFIVEIRELSDSLQHFDMPSNPPASQWVATARIALSHHFAGLLSTEAAALWDTISTAKIEAGVAQLRLATPAILAFLRGEKATTS